MVSQLNQDPRAESTADSGHGTIVMEEDVELNAVEEELIKDDTIFPISNSLMTVQWLVKLQLQHQCQWWHQQEMLCCHPLSHHGTRNHVSMGRWLKGHYRVHPQ